jgi:hypothetical protein
MLIIFSCCSFSGAPHTIPPQPFPPEVITEFTENCDAPLFLDSELEEWADLFEAHDGLTTSSQPTCDLMIFDGLTAHPITNPLLHGPLFCLQTWVRVVQSWTSPDVQHFNIAPGLWVAVHADSDEDTQDFWIGKIISVLQKRLNIHWWNFGHGRLADHGTEGTVPMGSVLACGFTFCTNTGVPLPTLQEIFRHL